MVQQGDRARILQAPVNYTVLTAASRAGSYDGPYKIINLSLEFTIWAAGDPSVSVGSGTPIYPGSAATWEQSGDLWLIAEGGSCPVTISYDVSDWQPNPIAVATAILNSGVIVVDKPSQFFQGLVQHANPTAVFDISKFSSLSIDIDAFPNPIVVKEINVYIEWFATTSLGTQIATQLIQFTPNAQFPKWSAQLPIVGAAVRFNVVGQVGQSCLIRAVSSHRPVSKMIQTIYQNGTNTLSPYLLLETLAILAGGITQSTPFGPWFGDVEATLLFTTGAAPGGSVIGYDGWIPGAPGFWGNFFIDPRVQGTPYGDSITGRLAMSGSMRRLSIVNGTGVNTNYTATIIPITGGPI